ncbi:unnamed protein product [Dovyalis caffra]|uniref:Uncharacterized protein n=1 Tax=Dovyalis caffra TaxID=77055 RepID=A0AAV1R4H3_9ROSI|nr:unnamed protein product [Dovyalis caffra]
MTKFFVPIRVLSEGNGRHQWWRVSGCGYGQNRAIGDGESGEVVSRLEVLCEREQLVSKGCL